jgi:hypothetical protein
MFHSFRTQVLHIRSLAWYLVTSEDAKHWYATLESFQFYNIGEPEHLLCVVKESFGWHYFRVEFEEEKELLWKLSPDHAIAKELRKYIEQYLQWIEKF